ncbi:MAG: glycosyltransferase [Bacteroidales bacterium]|nr:glycosyltransferase [Bacteroidales bacterium]
MTVPRVLLVGQPFNSQSGGGITLTNLFNGWPKDKIAVIAAAQLLSNISVDTCNLYYQLGSEEYKWVFPFNFFYPDYHSGPRLIKKQIVPVSNNQSLKVKQTRIRRYLSAILRWTGLFFYSSRISISINLKDWLSAFNPDIIYIQVSTREGVTFARKLCSYLKLPSAIHIMDDWPSTISDSGLFKTFWHRKIDSEFRKLLSQVNLHLSISDLMATEYRKRYGRDFIAFHNPIDIDRWRNCIKTDYSIDKRNISVLYAGRIGIGIGESLIDIATSIERMNDKGKKITLYIQTTRIENTILNRLEIYKCIRINPKVNYNQIPQIYASADILVLPNDFNSRGFRYLRLSMPTKTSEYMISGTPVLVYAPKESAVSQLFSNNVCGHLVSNRSIEQIIRALELLIDIVSYRTMLGQNAVKYASQNFNANIVKDRFQRLLTSLNGLDNS